METALAEKDRFAIDKLIADKLNLPVEQVEPDVALADLQADSLDIVEITMALEEEFGIEMPDEGMSEVKSVGDLHRFVGQLLSR